MQINREVNKKKMNYDYKEVIFFKTSHDLYMRRMGTYLKNESNISCYYYT